jgi:hypothetical protein
MPHIPTIPQSHLDRAAHRMRASGKTRFHESITEIYSGLGQVWIEQPNCPWNKRAKDGTHPLITGLQHFSAAISKPTPEPGKMPTWWQSVHPGDKEEDWIRRENETKQIHLEHSRAIWKPLMEHVDWKGWSEKDVELCLKAMPVYSFESERHTVMKALIKSGLPLEKLTHKGHPITPAMWSMINQRYSGDIAFWVAQDIPLDPPGDGPGAMSVLLLAYNWLSSDIKIPVIAQKMVDRGVDIERVGCTEEWRLSLDIKSNFRLYDDSHLLSKTIAGQAQSLGNAQLISLLAKHPSASDEARIESAQALISQYGTQERKKIYEQKDKDPQDYITSLWEVLNYNAVDLKTWELRGQFIVDKFITHLWGHGAVHTHPLADKCWEQICALTGNKVRAKRQSLADGMDNILSNVPPAELGEALNLDGFLSRIGLSRGDISYQCTHSLVKKALSYEGDGAQDKIRWMVDYLLGQEKLTGDSAPNQAITAEIMKKSSGAISLPNLSFLINSLEQGGWTPTGNGWAILRERIHSNEPDSVEIIALLTNTLVKHRVPVPYGHIINPPLWTGDEPNRTGYAKQYVWNFSLGLQAYEHFKKSALDCIGDMNTLPWDESGKKGLMQGLATTMLTASNDADTEANRDHCRRLDTLLQDFIAMGADPLNEWKNLDPNSPHWMEELERDHPFMIGWSEKIGAHLQNVTAQASARSRSRRM